MQKITLSWIFRYISAVLLVVLCITSVPVAACSSTPVYQLTASERILVAKLIDHEDNASLEVAEAVAQVVLNRVQSPLFPGTVEGVIYQRGQFVGASTLVRMPDPSDLALQAVDAVFGDGVDVCGDATFFFELRIPPWKVARGLTLVWSYQNMGFWSQKV